MAVPFPGVVVSKPGIQRDGFEPEGSGKTGNVSEQSNRPEVASPSGRVRVLFVTQKTSGVARRMESVVASLQTRNRSRVAVRVVDADEEPELVVRLGVRVIPAVVFLHDRRAVARVDGRATLEELEEVLTRCA
jgi:thioredoxin-like negative regulator of GroEL